MDNELLNQGFRDLLEQDAAEKAKREAWLKQQLEARMESSLAPIDWTPLAAQLDQMAGGDIAQKAAASNFAQSKANEMQKQKLMDAMSEQPDNSARKALLDLAKQESINERFAKAQENQDKRFYAGLENKQGEQLEAKKQKLAKMYGNDAEIAQRFGNIENVLGGDLETLKDDKKVNVPGTRVPGIGHVFMTSSKGRELQSDIKSIFNSLLKERSGTAVTDTELPRLQSEFEDGKWGSEQELLRGLAKVKQIAQRAVKQTEAAFPKEVVEQYRANDGFTYEDMYPASPAKGKKQTEDGKTALSPFQQRLNAMKASMNTKPKDANGK